MRGQAINSNIFQKKASWNMIYSYLELSEAVMDRLDSIRLFVRVVESGSFSAVARETGIGQPAVSKQIAALEAHLGAQLMRRTSRSMTLTDSGHTFYEAAVRLIGEFEAAESLIG